jgi:hypothetical protein
MDLVDAHMRALQYLFEGNKSEVFNCGYGHGYSVRQVLDVTRSVTGIDFPVKEPQRREGDSPILVADSSKLKQRSDWKPMYDELKYIVKTAWDWERNVRSSPDKDIRGQAPARGINDFIISVGATLRGCPECGRPRRAAPTIYQLLVLSTDTLLRPPSKN